ncbi:MAG: phage major capsid protein [Mycobacterium sp.]|nr:phage major capsid protein [Mycobacterium sp.]
MSSKDNGQRLSIKAIARTAVDEFGKRAKAGQKALAPGAGVVVGTEFQPNPIALGKIATTFLDLLPITQRDRNYDYLRQKTRTNNAAKVAEGALKPTSVYELERIENSLEVVAHLSEPIPRYWLVDNGSLEDFIATELEYGLMHAIELEVLADINATSGIQLQAFSTNVLQTPSVADQAAGGRPHPGPLSCIPTTGRASSSSCPDQRRRVRRPALDSATRHSGRARRGRHDPGCRRQPHPAEESQASTQTAPSTSTGPKPATQRLRQEPHPRRCDPTGTTVWRPPSSAATSPRHRPAGAADVPRGMLVRGARSIAVRCAKPSRVGGPHRSDLQLWPRPPGSWLSPPD